ncbi:plasmid partitioning protein RepB C-terminal domain-containing protein [Rhizobium mongolense]
MTLSKVNISFEACSLRIPIEEIVPLREISTGTVKSSKYAQIAASIREVGIIEPPVVVRDRSNANLYHLLDGHIRFNILVDQGAKEVVCLVAKDDEAFTYNKQISRLATIQEHKMILRAIEKGVPEERLARALNVDVENIKTKKTLLDGICEEVITLLHDRHVPFQTIRALKKLKPMRQFEAVQLMIAMNRFTVSYSRSLVAATPEAMLLHPKKPAKGLRPEQIEMMEKESANLDRDFKVIENDYGSDHLDLVLMVGYLLRFWATRELFVISRSIFPIFWANSRK